VNLIVYQQGRFVSVSVGLVAPPDVPAANRTWAPSASPLRGARVASLSPALAEELGLDSGLSGVVVLESGVGSGASRLGIKAGDIIRAINDREVLSVDDALAFYIAPFKPWSMTLTRAGQEVRIPPK
jgi:hypothetical protein